MHVRTNLCLKSGKNTEQTKTKFIINLNVIKADESPSTSPNSIMLKKTSFSTLKTINKIKLQFNFFKLFFKSNNKINPYWLFLNHKNNYILCEKKIKDIEKII